MTDVVIQVAPAQAIIAINEPLIKAVIVNAIITSVIVRRVPLVTTITSIGRSSISAIPNPIYIAERGVEAVAA